MTKTRTREVTIKESSGNFIFSKGKEKYDFEGLSALRKILSKEKARLLDVIKYKEPGSIYKTSKLLGRPFKAVFDDIKLLERMGFIEIKEIKEKGRICHKPIIVVDEVIVHLKI